MAMSIQVLTPQSCKEQGARIKKEGDMPRYAPHNTSLASCPSGRRSGWAVRRFNSLVLNEVPDVVLCLCAQGEGAFLRIAPQRCTNPKSPLLRGTFGPFTVSKGIGEPKD